MGSKYLPAIFQGKLTDEGEFNTCSYFATNEYIYISIYIYTYIFKYMICINLTS